MSSLSTRSDVSQRITKFVRYTAPRHHNLARGTSTRVKQYSLGAFKKPPSLHLPTLLKDFQTTQETLQQLKHSNTMPSPPDFNEKASTQPDQAQEESTPTTADQASGPQNANIFDLQQTIVSTAPPNLPPDMIPLCYIHPRIHTRLRPPTPQRRLEAREAQLEAQNAALKKEVEGLRTKERELQMTMRETQMHLDHSRGF